MKTTVKAALALAAAALPGQLLASPGPLITVDTTDVIYGGFSGAIDADATGTDAMLTWHSAGYGWSGNIALTDASGIILFNITTNNDDVYKLFAPATGDSLIGSSCATSGSSACVVLHSNLSLYSTISSLNGGNGICCGGGSDIIIDKTNGAVPEPASWALMLGGFGLVGGAMRSRRKASVTFA